MSKAAGRSAKSAPPNGRALVDRPGRTGKNVIAVDRRSSRKRKPRRLLAKKDTHVMVPIAEYDRLLKAEMALHAISQIEHADEDRAESIDAEDFAVELARDAIVKARKAAGLTQKQLGKKVGVPQSQISRIERNPDRTTVRTLKRIAAALGVNVSAFV